MKDVGLRIRVQRELRERFVAVCKAQDKSAAQVLREFMRAYAAENVGAPAVSDGEKYSPSRKEPGSLGEEGKKLG